MTTQWFRYDYPGAPALSEDGEEMLMVGLPDWVRLPPALGGAQLRVEGAYRRRCGYCGAQSRPVRHLALEGDMSVGECPEHGFVWYGARPTQEASDD